MISRSTLLTTLARALFLVMKCFSRMLLSQRTLFGKIATSLQLITSNARPSHFWLSALCLQSHSSRSSKSQPTRLKLHQSFHLLIVKAYPSYTKEICSDPMLLMTIITSHPKKVASRAAPYSVSANSRQRMTLTTTRRTLSARRMLSVESS